MLTSINLAAYPHLAAQFDVEANGGRTPDQIPARTEEKLWWRCPVAPDHRWRATGYKRTRGRGCPACAGKQISITNSLANYPHLVAQFDTDANGGVSADQVLAGSHSRLWWRCPFAPDHRWVAEVRMRVRGTGCPACAGRQVSVTNSLANHPHLATQFDVEANGGLAPDQVLEGSHQLYWWSCPAAADHRWQARPYSRVDGDGCPFCASRRVSMTNSLATVDPILAQQFDVLTNECMPDEVMANRTKKVAWICPSNSEHRWTSTINNRMRGNGCPACAAITVSAREVRLAAELDAVLGLDVTDQLVKLPGHRPMYVDVLCRQRMLVVEYDGARWHHGEKKERADRSKTDRLAAAGYTVVRARERPLPLTGALDVSVAGYGSIHGVTAEVLDAIARHRPDVLARSDAAAYRHNGVTLGHDAADARLARIRLRADDTRRRRHSA
ncbi:uncharacterized protein DUF559 [Jatrophihabitans sp. GAS493]|uniref:zinc-ribbon domain-containing protein n=1 Tax=Jatrophihabitans sp. GAS493 TaxID=1907575 RepID=UPI000BB7AF63|nr:zinc-ribbon domain-containing protein [Jatrophihabitans sp. GAS493]SOD73558.1 uncharacterized protein DUF559 [Jatrophihabitans sp. GAS493]